MKKLIAGVVTASALSLGGLSVVTSAAHADDYVVLPAAHVTTAKAGNKFTLKFHSGVVGMPAQGKVRWTYVKTPAAFNKDGDRTVRTHKLRHGKLKLNLHGKAFPVPGTYVLKFHVVGGRTFITKVVVK